LKLVKWQKWSPEKPCTKPMGFFRQEEEEEEEKTRDFMSVCKQNIRLFHLHIHLAFLAN